MISTYYSVAVTTHPWTEDQMQIIGYYDKHETATKVAKLVKDVHFKKCPLGLSTSLREYRGVGPGIVIRQSLDKEEIARLSGFDFNR